MNIPNPNTVTENTGPSHIFIGRVITMDDDTPVAEAVAVAGNKIVAVGKREDIEPLARTGTTGTQIIELGEKVLYPGFIEPHMHLWVTAINYEWTDCSAFANKTIDEVKKRLADAAAAAEPGAWVLGKLFDPSLLPGMPELTLTELDAIIPNNPVFVFNASMHFAYVNSVALSRAGITADMPNPAGGSFMHDENGALNGILSEMSAIEPVLQQIGISPEVVAQNAARITEDATRVGVTTMREAATGALFGAQEVSMLHHMKEQGKLKTRLSLALVDEAAKTWPETAETAPGAGDEFVWIGARKIVADGSNQGMSGYQSQPYIGSDNRGKLDIDPNELKRRIAWCHENGWQVMIHANGDAAVETVTNAYHEVLSQLPPRELRHRIEHCSLVNNDALFAKMKAVNVSPSFLINHVYYWGKTLRDNILGPDRIHMLDRANAAIEAGLKTTFHSDYNVSPINPLHYVQVAVTRKMWDNGEVLAPDQCISVGQAMRAITIDAAWQLNIDEQFGSITPGKFADFVILGEDPQEANPDEIDKIKIAETWLGGQPIQ
ncbi:MAG TPA: amidohydrolase [Candidatus Saccharimonadales bacterium]|nr:amidohydrolase [Candidatus Saccharimonadales bacterium]